MSSSILSNIYSKFSNQSLNSLESKKLQKNSSSTNNSINSMNSSNNTDMEIPITPKGWKVEFDPVLKQFFYINLFNNLVQLDHPDEVKTTPPSTPSASSSSSLTKKFQLNSSASSASSSSSSIFSLNDSQNPKKWYNKLNLKKSLSCNILNQHKKSIDSIVSNTTLPEEQEEQEQERAESLSDSHYSMNEEFDSSYESDNTDYVEEIQPYFLDDDNESNYILDYGSKNVEIDGNNEYIEEEEEEDQYESNLDYLNELKNLRELMAKENNIYKCQSIHGA
ncbi:unnamed protein product [[Candida] boidinii]|uniref:Unnamed protein product n=1 Tax=Candida boidinii TaxID=5477 RepID=A0A9W6WIL0_CANBO|nr:hypothetical protein B5S30_g5509 [[Candida] boidinii]GME75517.1 unnamed protein product [[Candida] boidinii]GMG16548.1 unnamed protein product [[Candida] boidinii]